MNLTHLNDAGEANMVDVSEKPVSFRVAEAAGRVYMKSQTIDMIQNQGHKKGDVIQVARIAGIQAAKKCSDLIPLCHPLMLSKVGVEFDVNRKDSCIDVKSVCKLSGQTGVEMEALTAVSVACLTLFDMCKAVDPEMVISNIRVLTKQGGKSGQWQRQPEIL